MNATITELIKVDADAMKCTTKRCVYLTANGGTCEFCRNRERLADGDMPDEFYFRFKLFGVLTLCVIVLAAGFWFIGRG